jgi:hypothetical protein
VTVNPVEATPLTVTVPAKPGIAFIAAWMFAAVYAWLEPPITAESLPPTRIWNGELKVTVPPPELARPADAAVYWMLRAVGTAVIVTVPL